MSSRQAIITQFPDLDLRELSNTEQAKSQLEALKRQSTTMCLGVGCIPSVQPETEGEKMVYDVARTMFAHHYNAAGPTEERRETYFALPRKPIFFDMAYKVSIPLILHIIQVRQLIICAITSLAEYDTVEGHG